LVFTRYCCTSRPLCTNESFFFLAPSQLPCPHFCNTIARLLRNIRRPPTPSLCAIHQTILSMAIPYKGYVRASPIPSTRTLNRMLHVKIRRHRHTQVHEHTGPRRHARAPACRRHHIPRLVRRQAFHTDFIGSPSLCG